MPGAGWGAGPWGLMAWGGGALGAGAGGGIPNTPPFDVYCGGVISQLLTYIEVETIGNPLAFPVNGVTLDQEVASGGVFPTTEAAIVINKAVPADFTLEFVAKWDDLPADFGDLVHKHSYFGAFSPGGGCVGLFFSKIGIAYTGAVHIDGGGTLVLDTPVQDLPNSQVLVSENEYWIVRIAMSFSTGAVYLYVTKLTEFAVIGHQLRYVLPAIPSASAAFPPPSITLIADRGTASAPTRVELERLCLGTGVIIPAIQPHADAGVDQAIRICSILQLDGSSSFDPQGAPLLYKWRLVAAPSGSQYVFDEVDGLTYPGFPPTGFTDKLYSAALEALDTLHPISLGGVVVLGGEAHDIIGKGVDGHGFYVQVEGFYLPDNLSTNTAFKYLPQNGLNTPTSLKPTFYPDIPGIYKFDLVVYDGSLYSEPAVMVANVVESIVARGCTPDLSFVWNYLSDFWKLVEDTERITTFWQGLAQVAAAELLNLWQTDYSKSLRDVQRTFQRRWLHYDLLMQESSTLLELSTVRAVYGGIESTDIPTAGVGGVSATHLDLQLGTLSAPTIISFVPGGLYTAVAVQAILQAGLAQVDTRIQVRLVPRRDGTAARVRIDAPFPITVLGTTTCPLYSAGQVNAAPAGTLGASVVTPNTYRAERSLQFLDIQPDDFLCIDGVAYRIGRVVDDVSDPFYFQRLTLLDALPVPSSTTWSIAGTVVSKDLDFWAGLCEASDQVVYEVLNNTTQTLTEVLGPVLGASSALPLNLAVDATPVGAYLAQSAYSVFLKGVLRRKYIPIDPLVVDVPLLQERIVAADDTQVLRRNVDFFFDTFRGQPCIRFITPVPANAGGDDVWQGQAPPAQLWAETTYLDNRPRIEGNFGIPAEFTLDDLAQLPPSVDYLSAVQGLWYAYFNGPTIFSLRVGTQILLGLPFAEQAGVIVEIRDDFSTTTGRILVQDLADTTIVREYSFPASLALETNPATGQPYVVGDTVAQFAPLITGVEIKDYVKDPRWFQGYLEQGVFFEVEKFFKFLVRVDSAAFNLSALMFVRNFALRVKPTYTYPLFVVLVKLGKTEITVTDTQRYHGTLHLFAGACFDGTMGAATMFDQPRPAYGGWRSQFDHNQNPATLPTYPTPNYPIVWGFDKNYLCPEDVIVGTCCVTFLGPTLPTLDSIFEFDEPVYTLAAAEFAEGLLTDIGPTSPPGRQIGLAQTIGAGGVLDTVTLQIGSIGAAIPDTFNLIIKKNSVTALTIPFTLTPGGFELVTPVALAVLVNDVLTCFIESTGAGNLEVVWRAVLVTVGQAVSWALDTALPAGTYCTYREM